MYGPDWAIPQTKKDPWYVRRTLAIPRLQGGLGNQLYIVASAVAYAHKHKLVVALDSMQRRVASFGKARPNYLESVFRLVPQLVTAESYTSRCLKSKLGLKLDPACVKRDPGWVTESEFDAPPTGAHRALRLIGYFQRPARFMKHR